jgi:phosphoribosylglycinamide formyltransferase-1
VLSSDTAETLAGRILAAEHRLYPHALRLVASGQATLQGGRVHLPPAINQRECLVSPAPSGRE